MPVTVRGKPADPACTVDVAIAPRRSLTDLRILTERARPGQAKNDRDDPTTF
jgi:hypothetical protein